MRNGRLRRKSAASLHDQLYENPYSHHVPSPLRSVEMHVVTGFSLRGYYEQTIEVGKGTTPCVDNIRTILPRKCQHNFDLEMFKTIITV